MGTKLNIMTALLLAAGLSSPSIVNAQQKAANGTESGSFTSGKPAAGSFNSGPPSGGSFATGKPAAGALTMGKPAAGSMSSGKPAAGSLGTTAVSGSLSQPAGETERVSGARMRRLQSVDDGSSYTRKARPERVRRY